jgi:hypothetical protein
MVPMSQFPSVPTQGATHTVGDVVWVFDDGVWRIVTYDAADTGVVSGGNAGTPLYNVAISGGVAISQFVGNNPLVGGSS